MGGVPSENLKYHRSEQALNARWGHISSRGGWTTRARDGVDIRRVQEAARGLCAWPLMDFPWLLGWEVRIDDRTRPPRPRSPRQRMI